MVTIVMIKVKLINRDEAYVSVLHKMHCNQRYFFVRICLPETRGYLELLTICIHDKMPYFECNLLHSNL